MCCMESETQKVMHKAESYTSSFDAVDKIVSPN